MNFYTPILWSALEVGGISCTARGKTVTNRLTIVRELTGNELKEALTGTCTNSKGGTKVWYQNGKIGRDGDLPAKEYADGTKLWYQNGEVRQ